MKSLIAESDNLTDKPYFRYRAGCHSWVMSIESKYIHMAIPKEIVDKRLKYWKITLDSLLALYKSMGFTIDYKESKQEMIFSGKKYSEFVVFILDLDTFDSGTLTNNAKRKARYFAFCMLRHFYYRVNLIKYFLVLNRDNKERDESIEISNWCKAKQKYVNYFYSYIETTRPDINYKDNLIISSHYSSNSSINMSYGYIYGSIYGERWATRNLESIFLFDRKTLELSIIDKKKLDSLKVKPIEDSLLRVKSTYGHVFVLPKKINIFECID